ncbi:flagellar biosynthesis protein FlgN [uncultured Tateyamaria sp.]|uniref:flagellar biosynthesis protein FlgN n=1 Tax=uncultured Tateyamaria sp. TaxID=455651 RepID=UPI002602B99E|nr:flagellar biosynthesis protein FlgN [uncultured Tateyamaria sp.]
MKHREYQDVVDEMDDLLDAERQALLAGKLDVVNRLYDRKSRLIDALSDIGSSAAIDPNELRTKIARNQELLESAADGIRSVGRRLAAIRRVRESLDTYDARGRRTSVDVKPGTTLEKRA